jgi:multiple RNA-binding domain-containing protein 1
MSRLCIKNLGKNTTEKQIKDLFSKKGEVTDVRIVKTKTGKSRRFAFVGFRTDLQAKEAQDYFHNTYLDTSRIQIESALKVNDSSLEEIKLRNSKKKLDIIELKKLEKAERKEKLNNKDNNKDEQKELSKIDKKKSREVQEFLEAMKPRRSAQIWGNDDTIVNNFTPEDNNTNKDNNNNNTNNDNKTNNTYENSSDSDEDEDDINDFTNIKIKTTDKKDKNNESRPKDISDMEYLRSKMSSNFSDSDDDKEIKSESMDEDDVEGGDSDDSDIDSDMNEDNEEKDDDGIIDEDIEDANDSGRLFIRNLPFSCSEDELNELFTQFGPVNEIHIPLDAERKGKGYSFVQYMIPEHAMNAKDSLDGSAFQGRLLHVIAANKPREADPDELKNKSNGRISSYQQKKEEERRGMAGRKDGWNASFVRSDAVVDSLAEKYGVERSDILDTKEGGGEIAVRLAVGEAMVIQENHAYFTSHGVDIAAIESISSSSKASARSTTTLLIKNLPHDLVEDELESMFSR